MKSRKGNAYIMVMIVTVTVFMLISIVLFITISSRQITARYGYYVGLYDLAVAGNEQVLFLLMQGIDANLTQINQLSQNENFCFIETATPFAMANLRKYFSPHGLLYRRTWSIEIDVTIQSEIIFEDQYSATTTVSITNEGFTVSTSIAKYANTILGPLTTVNARIIWTQEEDLGNFLDYYTLTMVELMRIAD